jgi:nucleotide-binding universal stress UspA family protein
MKKLLVPTDFSDNAEIALKFAINLANHFESKIYLLSVYQVHSPTGSMKDISRFLKEENEAKLSALVKKYKTAIFHDTSLEAMAINGSTISTIVHFADGHDVDLIIMGTQGSSGLNEIFIGSNTVGVIKRATNPILAIPNGYVYKPFKKIVLALDESSAFPEKQIKPLLSLAKSYKSKILVYRIIEPDEKEGVSPSIHEYLKGMDYSIHESIGISNINEGINAFVTRNEADMLCMITRKRRFLEGIFNPSVTRKEAFNCPVPLLVLRALD